MEDELSDAVARFVLEAGGIEQASASLRAYAKKHSSTGKPDEAATPSASIVTLSPLLFSPNNALDRGVGMPNSNTVISSGDEEILDPWRSPGTRQTTAESDVWRGHGVFSWGEERQNESASLAMQTPPPQPFSPTEDYPRENPCDLSAMPLLSINFAQRPTSSPSRSLDQRRPVLPPSEPSPYHYPVSTPPHSLPLRHPGPPVTTHISPSARNQQSHSISQQSNQRLVQTHSQKAPVQRQAHPLSRESLALSSSYHRDVQESHPTSSIRPILSRQVGGEGLDQRLAAITPKDSKLTTTQFRYVASRIKQDKWYLGEAPFIRLVHPNISVRVLVTAPKPATIKSKSWYSVSRGTRIGIFYNWNLVKTYTSGYDAVFQGWKTEYEAYIAYQECLLRGEVMCINLPGDEGSEGDDDDGNASDEYFDDWPI